MCAYVYASVYIHIYVCGYMYAFAGHPRRSHGSMTVALFLLTAVVARQT
jgi:hypothetical protein